MGVFKLRIYITWKEIPNACDIAATSHGSSVCRIYLKINRNRRVKFTTTSREKVGYTYNIHNGLYAYSSQLATNCISIILTYTKFIYIYILLEVSFYIETDNTYDIHGNTH